MPCRDVFDEASVLLRSHRFVPAEVGVLHAIGLLLSHDLPTSTLILGI